MRNAPPSTPSKPSRPGVTQAKRSRFIEQEKWNDARAEALAAYQLRPTEPQALLAVARFLSRTRQPDALKFWKRLGKKTALIRDDLRDQAALTTGETSIAESAVKNLLLAPVI